MTRDLFIRIGSGVISPILAATPAATKGNHLRWAVAWRPTGHGRLGSPSRSRCSLGEWGIRLLRGGWSSRRCCSAFRNPLSALFSPAVGGGVAADRTWPAWIAEPLTLFAPHTGSTGCLCNGCAAGTEESALTVSRRIDSDAAHFGGHSSRTSPGGRQRDGPRCEQSV